MGSTGDTFRARWADRPLPETFRKSRTSASGMWSKAVMSAPFPDLAGDVLVMDGMDFTLHKADPSVDLEHGRDPGVRHRPVAWMRESLSEPGADYALEWARLNFGGDGAPDDFHTVPVCTNYFDKSCRVSSQVFALVEQDALPSVSVEFRPVRGFMKSLGKSPIEPRDAYEFGKSRVCGLAVCQRGVCPHALTLTKSAKNAPQVPGLEKILRDRRVNVGGTYEPLCEVILKALAAPAAPKRTTVRVEKAMGDDRDDMAPPGATDAQPDADLDTAAEDEGMGDEAPASGGVAAKLAFVQACSDACQQYQADMQSSDHPGLRKAADADVEAMEKLLAKIQARAQKHDALLSGGGDEAPDDDEADDDLESDDDAAEGDESDDDADDSEGDEKPGKKKGKPFGKALRLDDEGVVACRRVYRKSLHEARVKRFSLSALDAAPAPRPVKKAKPEAPADDPADLEYLAAQKERLARNLRLFRPNH